jgi:hypothetical protein
MHHQRQSSWVFEELFERKIPFDELCTIVPCCFVKEDSIYRQIKLACENRNLRVEMMDEGKKRAKKME